MGEPDHLPGAGVTGAVAWVRRWYGAHPLHLLALLASFALAGYAVHAVVAAGQWRGFALWFAVAIVGHDLLLFPLYSVADLSLRRLLPRRAAPARPSCAGRIEARGPAAAEPRPAGPPILNYIRIPIAFSLLLLLVWFPLILGLSRDSYQRASGLSTSPYLWRWLAVTGAAFAISSVCYAIALRRTSARGHGGGRN
jgi:hypothetical protein